DTLVVEIGLLVEAPIATARSHQSCASTWLALPGSSFWLHWLVNGTRYGQDPHEHLFPASVASPTPFADGYRIETATSWPPSGGRTLRTSKVVDAAAADALSVSLADPLPRIQGVSIADHTVSWNVDWGGLSPAGGVIRVRQSRDTFIFPPDWT